MDLTGDVNSQGTALGAFLQQTNVRERGLNNLGPEEVAALAHLLGVNTAPIPPNAFMPNDSINVPAFPDNGS